MKALFDVLRSIRPEDLRAVGPWITEFKVVLIEIVGLVLAFSWAWHEIMGGK
jgi:hypothetical protein